MSQPEKLKNYINGEWRESHASQYLDVCNPATQEVLAQTPLSTAEDVDLAARVAASAQLEWRKVPGYPARAAPVQAESAAGGEF